MKVTREQQNQQAAKVANAKKRKRRRHGRYTLHYILIGIFVFAAGVALSLTVFFKIEGVDLNGNTKYLDEQIISVAAIPIGENMFMVDRDEIKKRISDSFTYIDEVNIGYRLPPRISIDIKEAVPIANVEINDTSYAIVSDKGKVLEIMEGVPPEGEALVVGLGLKDVKEGSVVDPNSNEAMKMLSYVDKAIEETGFQGIDRIDVSDRLNISLLYDDRIVIELGTEGELEYKMRFADYALKNSIEENFEGVIDASITKEVRIRATKLDENKKPIKNKKPDIIVPSDELKAEETEGSSSSSQAASGALTSSSTAPSSPSSQVQSSSSSESSSQKNNEPPEVTPIGSGHDIKTG